MSRNSNRGPRADIALLRKLKADPNFSPSSLLNSGPNFLEKANKLKGFVAEQRGKLCVSSAKTEWLLAYQHLQGEQDDVEKELSSYLQQLGDQHQATELREVAESVYTLQSQTEACRAERLQLRSRVKRLSSAHASYRSCGSNAQFPQQAHALQGEISTASQEVQATLNELADQVQILTGQLRDVWPSALAGPGEGLGGLGSSSVSGSAAAAAAAAGGLAGGGGGDLSGPSGYGSRTEDAEELEKMMARYPLASSDIKDRIREVFRALQDKYLERLETWRLEAEQSARDLATSGSGSSSRAAGCSSGVASSVAASAGHLPRRSHHHQQPANCASLSSQGRAATGTAAGNVGAGRAGAASGVAGRGGRMLAAAAPGGGSPGPPAFSGPTSVDAGEADGAAAGGTGGGGGGGSGARGFPDVSDSLQLLLSPTGRTVAGGSWAFSGCGGWSAEEHSAFVRHRDRLMKESGQGPKAASREVIMGRIANLLPGGRTAAEVMAHDDWTTAARLLARKRRDLAEGWERERRQFVEDSSSFLQESETAFFVQAEEAADRLVAELLREKARDELQELRAERAREEEVAAAERAAREAAEAEARLAAEARERRFRSAQKDMLAAYRVELERQVVQELAATAEAERQAALAAEQQAVINKERVEVRQAEYLEKQDRAKERQEALEAEARARAARLDRLRALVAPCVEADPARVLAPTAASAAAVDKVEGAFNPVNGYTTEQVVKDQRFKVFEALAAVGLQQTDYGRQVIAAARPARPTRPDNFTTDQREALQKKG